MMTMSAMDGDGGDSESMTGAIAESTGVIILPCPGVHGSV